MSTHSAARRGSSIARTIGSPRSVAHAASAPTRRQARQSANPKRTHSQERLQFGRVLPPCLVPQRVAGERRCRHADLFGHERDHRLGRPITGAETLARIAQEAELHGEPEPVHAAPLGPDERQVVDTEHVVSRHLGTIGWDGEQAIALLGGQQGTAGHGGFVPEGRGRS